jgi:hypothetical protein
LEVPCTVGFTRRGAGFWSPVHRTLSHDRFRKFHPIGILWRLGIIRKVTLSPEGNQLGDQLALLRVLGRQSSVVLNVTLHSPSIEPGRTPFVQTAADRDTFLHTLRETLRFAREELGARAMTFREFAASYPLPVRHDRTRNLSAR